MKPVLVALVGAILSVLAFPPFGPGWLILPGITLFLAALRLCTSPRQGLIVGSVYGLVFFGGVMWWLAELEIIALVLVPEQALFFAVYGWWLARHAGKSGATWIPLAVGGWAIVELIRYRFPVGGVEWGAAGYALSDSFVSRAPAAVVGTTGLTVVVVLVAAQIAIAYERRTARLMVAPLATIVIVAAVVLAAFPRSTTDSSSLTVAIVQGSTPCPFEHCPPNERFRTYQQHLALTRTIEPGLVDLVVWSEGSTGSTNADPVLNPEVREAIGAEARRIGAAMLVGGDRVTSDTQWINANVYFDREGELVGEYRKQHPVPFGEYIPLRPLFSWIPALDQVPRDMIRGDGPVVFDRVLGSVISFEGGFARYALATRRAGAELIVVATNEASYGPEAATSDQFIGMTRMRAVELGAPVVHAAVTGRSTFIDHRGDLGAITDLGAMEVIYGETGPSTSTPYTAIGDLVMYLAAAAGAVAWWRSRTLVGSGYRAPEED